MSGIHRFRVQKIMLNQCFKNINFILAQKYWSISFPTVGKDRQYRLVNENWCHPVIPTPVPSMHTSIPLILLFEYSHPFPNPLFCSYPRHIVTLLFECGRGLPRFFLILHWHKLTLNCSTFWQTIQVVLASSLLSQKRLSMWSDFWLQRCLILRSDK